MQGAPSTQVTNLLTRWRGGEREALDALLPLVYQELRRLARNYLQRERRDHTLQPTALVHEAYFRLVKQSLPEWQNRAHFFAIAAQLMRQILLDYARSHGAAKRGAGICKLTLERAMLSSKETDVDLVVLDEALKQLAKLDLRQSRIIELRFFAGLSIEDTAEVLGVSPATVNRDWTTARAWLHREISRSTSA